MLLMSSANFFQNIFKDSFTNTLRLTNGLDPDQRRRSVCPDLGPNYLEWLSADDRSRPHN